MSAAPLSLSQAAASATASLNVLWDAMGVGADERAAFLTQTAEDVASIYASRVASQAERRAAVEAEIEALKTTIRDMQTAMEEPVELVRRAAAARLAH